MLCLSLIHIYGRFQSGFWNSYFGQRGVLRTTDGYNYLANNDDVYLYTGMTSVTGDQSNVGFVLVNMRTKETKFYPVPGAEENSAMSSAQGKVQHLDVYKRQGWKELEVSYKNSLWKGDKAATFVVTPDDIA